MYWHSCSLHDRMDATNALVPFSRKSLSWSTISRTWEGRLESKLMEGAWLWVMESWELVVSWGSRYRQYLPMIKKAMLDPHNLHERLLYAMHKKVCFVAGHILLSNQHVSSPSFVCKRQYRVKLRMGRQKLFEVLISLFRGHFLV